MNEEFQHTIPVQADHSSEEVPLVIDPVNVDNAVLKRLIGEVRSEKENNLHAYNRSHNRHNRGR